MPKKIKSKKRKQQILSAAEKVFAENGYQETTISAIAKEAKISDATIYEYFSNKEELLFSIPADRIQQGLETGIYKYIYGAGNKLRTYLAITLGTYQANPQWASVVMLILKQNRNFLKTDTYQMFRESTRTLIKIIEEGIASGEFRSDIDPYLVRSLILGFIEHTVIRSLLIERKEDLLEYVRPIVDIIVRGLEKDTGIDGYNFRVIMEPNPGKTESND